MSITFTTATSSLSNRYKGALLYGLSPVCALGETEHPGHLNVRGVLRHCVSSKGLHPLRRESGYSLNVKGVTSKSHAFYLFYCLTNTPRSRRFLGDSVCKFLFTAPHP